MSTPAPEKLRVAVIGHVEHVMIGRADALPHAGEIVHLDETVWIPGGGGGIAFHQLVHGPGDVHLFTAIGNDDAGAAVERAVRATGAHVHVARRDEEPHTRDLVIVTSGGERTIFVVGEPLHPHRSDGVPWDVLATCDAVYFTGQDPHTLVTARKARALVVTARRAAALAKSGVRADVVVGSTKDRLEASTLADYPVPPVALVMTEGAAGGHVETAEGVARFPASTPPQQIVGTYGSGDTFAAALTWYLARGLPVVEACTRAAAHGAAVLRGVNPLEWQRELE